MKPTNSIPLIGALLFQILDLQCKPNTR